jgi:hypothetical protein
VSPFPRDLLCSLRFIFATRHHRSILWMLPAELVCCCVYCTDYTICACRDEQVSGILMESNLIHDVMDQGFYMHCGSDNVVVNSE